MSVSPLWELISRQAISAPISGLRQRTAVFCIIKPSLGLALASPNTLKGSRGEKMIEFQGLIGFILSTLLTRNPLNVSLQVCTVQNFGRSDCFSHNGSYTYNVLIFFYENCTIFAYRSHEYFLKVTVWIAEFIYLQVSY